MTAESAAVAVLFALLHVAASRLQALSGKPRSVWLSLAGGVSCTYVFLHLLPELHEGQQALITVPLLRGVLENEGIYLVALAGITVFHGLERMAVRSRTYRRAADGNDCTGAAAFSLHIGSFAIYNMVIGYLLVHGENDSLGLYAVAMGLHFLVNAQSLREHHKERYDAVGRWVLAAAVISGWAVSVRFALPEPAIQLLLALLSGGIILNALKEELAQERDSRFSGFLAGAVLYAALLLAI